MAGTRLRAADHGQSRRVPVLRGYGCKVLALDDGNELQVRRAQFAPQETVDVERALRIVVMNARERVEADAGLAQGLSRRVHRVERRRVPFRHAALVVNFARTVDAQADQEAMLLKERGPFVIEQRAIGLQVIFDALARLCVPPLQRDHLAEEVEPHQRGLAALPRENDFIARHAFDVVPDETLEQCAGQVAATGSAGQRLLCGVKASGYAQV